MDKCLKTFVLYFVAALGIKFAFAQQNHFVYMQSENNQPFYLKADKKIISSTTSGYVILPKLKEGEYSYIVGFPKNDFPEQSLKLNIQNKDEGYLLKNFNDKGLGLLNFQTFDIVYLGTNNKVEKNQPIKQTQPLVKEDEVVVKETPKQIEQPITQPEKNDTKTEIVKKSEPIIDVAQKIPKQIENKQIVGEPQKNEVQPEVVKQPSVKITETPVNKTGGENNNVSLGVQQIQAVNNNDGAFLIYIDRSANKIDTVKIFIPNTQIRVPIKEEIAKTVIETPKPIQQTELPIKKEEVVVKKAEIIQELPKEEVVVSKKSSSCKNVANEDDYKKLRKKMASANDDNEMIYKAHQVFEKNCFTTEQIRTLSYLFLTDEGKYKFFDEAFKYISDIENFPTLQQNLKDTYYINRFKAILK